VSHFEHWGWIVSIDNVSKHFHWDWDKVTEMNVVYFLNVIGYLKDKSEFEAEQIKKARG
jgi:hypothetical protein